MTSLLRNVRFYLAVAAFVLPVAMAAGARAVEPVSRTLAQVPSVVDLNTASEAQLQGIKGIGPAFAKKIIAGRPYKSVDELVGKGIPQRTVDGIRPLVTVGGGQAPAATPSVAKPALPAPPAAAPTTPALVVPPAKAPVVPVVPSAPAAAIQKGAKVPAAATAKLAPGQKVNINTAPVSELEALPGVGAVKAQKIVEGRPYSKPEDIMKVSGIKEGIFAKLKDSITVQ